MNPAEQPNLVAIEVVVRDLADAVAFFADALGFSVVFRGSALDAAGELAVVDAGGVALTLLEPSDVGEHVMSDRSPRVTQLVFGTPPGSMPEVRDRIEQRGVGVESTGADRFFVPPQVTEGVLGPFVTLTFSAVESD